MSLRDELRTPVISAMLRCGLAPAPADVEEVVTAALVGFGTHLRERSRELEFRPIARRILQGEAEEAEREARRGNQGL